MNNLLKSVFISVYATYVVVMAAFAAREIYLAPNLAWAGILLVHAPIALVFIRIMLLKDRARLHPWLPVTSLIILAGSIMSLAGFLTGGSVVILPTVTGLITYLLYLFWYSRFSRSPAVALQIGGQLPPFTTRDTTGAQFSTEQLRGNPAVLLFYRGNWCPLCMAQVREIAAAYKMLAEQNIQVVLISPQPQTKTAQLARRFDAPMRFVVDAGNRYARQLGIAWSQALPAGMQFLGYDSESVLPTVIVTDSHGRIVLADQTDNYRIRPEPETFIAALRDS